MNADILMNAIGEISGNYIAEANDYSSDKNNFKTTFDNKNIKNCLAIAASFFAVLITAVTINHFLSGSDTPILSTTPYVTDTIELFIDKSSNAGFDYQYCYSDESMSGNVGIADSNGSIILDPDYQSVSAVSSNRFIVRKFIDYSAHCALVDENAKEIIPFFRGEIRTINKNSYGDNVVILSVEPFADEDYFTDLNGKKIISQTFRITGFTYFDVFYGCTDDAYFLFDNKGNHLCSLKENEIGELTKTDYGYTMLAKNCGKSLKFGLKNSDREIIPCEYDEITFEAKERIVARIGDTYATDPSDIVRVFDSEGNLISDEEEYTKIYATNPNKADKPTSVYAPEKSDLNDLYGSGNNRFGYRKKGNLYYIDDKAVAEEENGSSSDTYRSVNAYGTSLKKIAVNFTYGETEWQISSYKGVYGYRMVGSDTVLSTIPKGNSFNSDMLFNSYYIPPEDNWLKIQIDTFDRNGNAMFSTDYSEHWWANGFVESDIQSPNEMLSKTRITFKDAEMANLFVAELAKQGFMEAENNQSLAENTYYISGSDVWFVF